MDHGMQLGRKKTVSNQLYSMCNSCNGQSQYKFW